jgi:hypothetical protein
MVVISFEKDIKLLSHDVTIICGWKSTNNIIHSWAYMKTLLLIKFATIFYNIIGWIDLCHNPTLRRVWSWDLQSRNGNLESFGTPETSELDCRGQNTSPWGVLYTVGKVLKSRCRKWPRMSHSDICSTSYGRKKGQESNWQFNSWPQKSRESTRPQCVEVECETPLESSWGELQVCFKPHPSSRSELGVMSSQSLGSLNRDNFETPPWESQE